MIKGVFEKLREFLLPMPDDFDQMILETYLWGNRHFPQASQGIAMNFANFALSQEKFSLERFLDRKLTQKELIKLGDAMDDIHAVMGINYATERGTERVRAAIMKRKKTDKRSDVPMNLVTEERLQRLWVQFKVGALEQIAFVAGVEEGSDAWPLPSPETKIEDRGLKTFPKSNMKKFSKILQNPETFSRVRETFASFKETLLSDEGKRLGLQIRDAASARTNVPPYEMVERDTRAVEVTRAYHALIDLCVKDFRERRAREERALTEVEEDLLDDAAENIKDMN